MVQKFPARQSRRSTKAENEAAAALIVAIISLFFWIIVGAINLCIEHYQSVCLEIHTYPHLKEKIIKRELYGWGFLVYSGIFYWAVTSESVQPPFGALILATLPIGLVSLFLWARNLSQASTGRTMVDAQRESESA